MEIHHKEEMKHLIEKIIGEDKFTGKNIFVFGHCNASEEMLDYLFERGIAVAAILDNNKNKQGRAYKGTEIVSPQIIKQFSNKNSIVLIATRFFEPMSSQLRGLGYDGEIVKVIDYNSFAEYSISDGTIKRKTERMLRGSERLKLIRRQYSQHHLVVCPNCALGDVYWACAYLPAYCTKKNIAKVAIVVIGNSCRQIAEMFGHKDFVVINHVEMDELVQGIIFNHEDNSIIAHHDRPYTDNIIKYLDKHFMSFTDYYKHGVFGLSDDVEPSQPLNIKELDNKSQIIEGKSVILAPYAKSVVQPPLEFWDVLVKEYQTRGYHVFTNIVGDEAPIAKTNPITLPLNQLIKAVEYAGYFIGLRSGLCDVIVTANCHKTVVMPDCIYSTTNVKVSEFFSLPGWEQITVM